MSRFMLDTNAVSHLMRGNEEISQRVQRTAMPSLCISAITEGELRFGLARRPHASRLHQAVSEFLKRVDTLPWDNEAALRYGALRAGLQQKGQVLAPLDLLIASHALSAGVVLVTNDQAFAMVPGLGLEDWTAVASHD